MKRVFVVILSYIFLLAIASSALAQNNGVLVLTRSIFNDDNVMPLFIQDHPKIRIKPAEKVDSFYSELAECIINRDDSFDVFDPWSSEGVFKMLRDKGYFIDLSKENEVMAYINSLYPVIKNQLLQDNQVLGIPFDFQLRYMFVYNGAMADEIGLSTEDIPKTLPELLDFTYRWNEDYSEAFPDYYPFYVEDNGLLPNQYLDLAMEMYRYHCIANSGDLTYDTPLFLSLLDAVKPFTKQPATDMNMDEGSIIESPGAKDCLFYCVPANMRDIFGSEYLGQIPPLPLEEGAKVLQPYEIECAVVNPYSKNTELAVELTKYIAEYADPNLIRALSPEINTPYERPSFQEELQSWISEKSRAEKALQTAKPENKKELEATVNFWADMINHQDELRYAISPQMLDRYQTKIAPYLYPIGESIFGNDIIRYEARSFAKQWIDGLITAKQFAQEMNRYIKMIIAESPN